ncbi:MAG: hypothetical protein JXA90_15525 [Planctomycetes bacterium]|nr:hypothetical protein [Planctomycetota bacterium]
MFPAQSTITRTSLLAALLLASGCGSVPLDDEARTRIAAASVAIDISERGSYTGDIPGIPYSTRGAVWYSTYFTAPVGMVIDLIDYSDNQAYRRTALECRMRDADIPVGSMVASDLARRLLERGIVRHVARDEAETAAIRFRLAVEYGLDDGMGLRGSWKPWLDVEASLVDETGRVLWSHEASKSCGDHGVAEFLDPFWDPARLRGSYASQARAVVAELVRHLERG